MATFGKTDIVGLSSTTPGSSDVRAAFYSLAEAGTVTHLSVYFSGGASNTQVHRFVIYDDDGAGGIPGTQLGITAEQTIGVSQAAGWITAALVTPVALAAGTYWIGFHSGTTNGACNYWRKVTATDTAYVATDTYSDGTAATFPAGAYAQREYAVYATYTPTPVGDVPTVTTTAITAITATTASSGGTITDEGDSAVTAFGVCWNTSGSPTTADSHTHDG